MGSIFLLNRSTPHQAKMPLFPQSFSVSLCSMKPPLDSLPKGLRMRFEESGWEFEGLGPSYWARLSCSASSSLTPYPSTKVDMPFSVTSNQCLPVWRSKAQTKRNKTCWIYRYPPLTISWEKFCCFCWSPPRPPSVPGPFPLPLVASPLPIPLRRHTQRFLCDSSSSESPLEHCLAGSFSQCLCLTSSWVLFSIKRSILKVQGWKVTVRWSETMTSFDRSDQGCPYKYKASHDGNFKFSNSHT